ncbi:enoyl-CoA hydratase/isomerase family protein [Paroceanicella profunda]|uniref:3-hydroxyisobutyryl-CoA hydrolase n=1 Tax=Paroceanicella profunda TaxID=2579971 RepID=A0A5B8FWV0_9RHOB|nr:enoyl-CoA hydratase/isomerase family protein [Paroceanicella profunda]QDL90523.1 enoyl-CoA hydratase/isomerase family protein [Paroceanicella profunda]
MTDDIHIRTEGAVGRITLTRPQALNALSHQMALAIEAALDAWAHDDAIAMVLCDAEGERAFCAGGDIGHVRAKGVKGNYDAGRRFWADEYRMNAKLARFPKPYVALMHGFVMGGGVGISTHGSHRVVTDSTRLAMPECGIGLIPDVGGSLILGRAPGRIGEYLGLTGTRIGAADAIFAGFADVYVPEAELPALTRALVEEPEPGAVLRRFAATPPGGVLAGLQADIDHAFSGELSRLPGALSGEAEWQVAALKALRHGCPLSIACTLELVRAARADPMIEHCLAREYRFTWRCMDQGEFMEGVRAAIVDKDRNPHWRLAPLEAVTPEHVAALLAHLGADELSF